MRRNHSAQDSKWPIAKTDLAEKEPHSHAQKGPHRPRCTSDAACHPRAGSQDSSGPGSRKFLDSWPASQPREGVLNVATAVRSVANWVDTHRCGPPGAPPPAEELTAHLHHLRQTLSGKRAPCSGGSHTRGTTQEATTRPIWWSPMNSGSRTTTQTTRSRRSYRTQGKEPACQKSSLHQCRANDQPSTSAAFLTARKVTQQKDF